MSPKKHKPRGREAVTRALIEAAAELFSKYGLEAVSVRDIAARAGVNHGLIHRHFGSKEVLRQKTQEYLAAGIRDEIGVPADFEDAMLRGFETLQKQPAFWRVLARTFLDGEEHGEVQSEFPFIRFLVELAREGQSGKRINTSMDPRFLVASILAFGLGMLVFEKYILAGTGLDAEPPESIRQQMTAALSNFVTGAY
ncbi:MAG: TetR/AcrR family transcriptional regulator [Thermodesulfobacteriota bacterium]